MDFLSLTEMSMRNVQAGNAEKWAFIQCTCGHVCRRQDNFKRHRRSTDQNEHEIALKVFRCIGLGCDRTHIVYSDWVEFRDNHMECFDMAIERDSAKRTKLLMPVASEASVASPTEARQAGDKVPYEQGPENENPAKSAKVAPLVKRRPFPISRKVLPTNLSSTSSSSSESESESESEEVDVETTTTVVSVATQTEVNDLRGKLK